MPASPSITVTMQGVDATQATSEVTASGNDDTTTDTAGNSVSLDSEGVFIGFSAASGWTAMSISNPSMFTADSAGALEAPSLASGNGSVFGTSGLDAVAEVTAIEFDGATAGSIVISGSVEIPWDADATTVESALEAATGRALSVTGIAGQFEVMEESPGDVVDLSIDLHTLTK